MTAKRPNLSFGGEDKQRSEVCENDELMFYNDMFILKILKTKGNYIYEQELRF